MRKKKKEKDLTFRKNTSLFGLSLSERLALPEVGCYGLRSDSVKKLHGGTA